jgi:hypothetical protein
MGDSDDEEEVERDYRRNRHKYEAEGEEEADGGEADEVGAQEILDFDSDIAVLKARWVAEKEEVSGLKCLRSLTVCSCLLVIYTSLQQHSHLIRTYFLCCACASIEGFC